MHAESVEVRGVGLIQSLCIAALLMVVVLPVSFVVLQAIFPHLPEGSLRAPFSAIARTFGEQHLAQLLGNTVVLGLSVSLASLLLALPLAVLRGTRRLPGAKYWDLLFLIPFMIPPYIGAFSWVLSLQDNGYARQLFGWSAEGLLFSFPGIVLVMSLHLFPLVYFALSRSLMLIGKRFADAGKVCGASAFSSFLRITLPLSLPGMLASLLLVFALTVEEYGTPATLGKRSGFLVLVTSIEEKFAEWPIDLPGAALLSLALVALVLLAFWLQHYIVTRRSFITVAGKQRDEAAPELGRMRWPALGLFASVTLLATGIPIGATLACAFSRTLSGGLAWDNFGLRHFIAVFENRNGALDALFNSLWLAAATAIIAGILGALTAYVSARTRLRGRSLLDAFSALPNALPGMVVAVGMILAWNRSWWPVPIYNTPVVLLLAYICLMLPYPVRYVGAGLRQISQSLDAAARVCGATSGRVLWRILLPLIAPNLFISMLLVFAVASRELVASVMLAPTGMPTVATFVFNQFAQGSPGVGMALSVIAIFSSTAILVTVRQLFKHDEL
ncbi:iron ABC transporter permease [Uliginosibacterium sp. H3]|uniref:Iron ABC transporter permease n=1 Tax=Uliginosibacterium silvisoli TaxID=3114758 RepID=A0ABU6K8F0_9RHOO|nr:iron ABC transporter permease [Uliginosibacterium sp. H3]